MMFGRKPSVPDKLKKPENKKELIENLEYLLKERVHGRMVMLGYTYHKYLIEYLKKLPIDSFTGYELQECMGRLVTDAFRELRDGTDELSVFTRGLLESGEIPNLTKLGMTHPREQSELAGNLARLIRDAFGDDELTMAKSEAYFNGELYALQLKFDEFLHLVYRRGMRRILNESNARFMSGNFGKTIFTCGGIASTRSLSFERHGWRGDRHNFCFMCARDSENDPVFARLSYVDTDLKTCLDMIDDVITHWPKDESAQKKMLWENKKAIFG